MPLQGNTISLRFRGPNPIRIVGNSNENNNSSTSSTNSSIRQSSSTTSNPSNPSNARGGGARIIIGSNQMQMPSSAAPGGGGVANAIANATRGNIINNNTGNPAAAQLLQNQNQNNQNNQSQQQQQQRMNVNINLNPTNPLAYPGRIRFPSQLVPNLSHQLAHNRPPPLLETPHIHTNSQTKDDDDDNDNDNDNDDTTNIQKEDEIDHEMKELECGICYDILQNPSHCGSCSARFCHSCLSRALQQATSCPSCRKEISSSASISLDKQFFDKFKHLYKKCKYPNCNKKCKAEEIMHHDSVCEFKPMNCKYSPFGCKWYGARKDVNGHYSVGCEVQKLAPLIEGMRQQQQLVHLLNARFIQERQASSQIRNQLVALEMRSGGNLFDLLYVIYTCMCTPGQFLAKAVIWRNFWNCQGVRCIVNNFICLGPICLYAVKHLFKGLGYISLLLESFGDMMQRKEDQGQGHELDQEEEDIINRLWGRMTMLFMEATLSICTVIIGGLFLICFVSTLPIHTRTLLALSLVRTSR